MGRDGAPEAGAVSLSESVVGIAASFNPAVRSNRWLLGGVNRPGPGGVRHPLAAKDEGDADLSENQQFAGGAAPTRPHPSLRVRSGIWGLKLTTPWRSPSRPRCSSGNRAATADQTVAVRPGAVAQFFTGKQTFSRGRRYPQRTSNHVNARCLFFHRARWIQQPLQFVCGGICGRGLLYFS